MLFRRKLPFAKLRPKKSDEEPPYPDESDIRKDMRKRSGVIKFDLSDDKWMTDPEAFWAEFKHTGEILIPDDFERWLIGQERMKEEFFMNLEEHVRKMKDIQELRKATDSADKDVMRRFLKERPGPYLLFVGEPGTGKSLLIKIANSRLKKLYKEHNIELQDMLLIKNPRNHQRPIPKYLPAGKGKLVKEYQEHAQGKTNIKTTVIKSFLGFVMLIGGLLILTAVFLMAYIGMTNDPDIAWFRGNGVWLQYLFYGMMLVVFPLMITLFFMGGMGGLNQGRRQKSEADNVPALLIDNSGDPDLFVDVTQSNASKLFGSVQHDPWQDLNKDTEILTEDGWFPIYRAAGHRVATLSAPGEIEYQIPIAFVEKFRERLVEIKTKRLDISASEVHNLYASADGKNFGLVPSVKAFDGRLVYKRTGVWHGKTLEKIVIGNRAYRTEDWMEFLGYWLSEGSAFVRWSLRRTGVRAGPNYVMSLRQKRGPVFDKMRSCLERMGHRPNLNGEHIRVFDRELVEYLMWLGKSATKRIPREFMSFDVPALRILFDALMLGDGTRRRSKVPSWAYYSKSKGLIDDVQEIAFKLGFSAVVSSYRDTRLKTFNGYTFKSDGYILYITTGNTPVVSRPANVQWVPYNDKTYCVAVPNGVIYVRRNGKPVWIGNSGGLGTPTHHRMQAGVIHEADKKILYADEFKNFLMNEQIVVEFLTPLEEGAYAIRGREWAGAAGNASLAGETDTPVDCAFFLIAAANYDALPLLNRYPALRNRFAYGNIVRAEDEIDATPQNEIKIAQFLADEAYRFKTPPVCREAVKTVIAHARRKGSAIDKMRLKMRPYIQDLKKAAQIVWRFPDEARGYDSCACGLNVQNMIHRRDMVLAIEEYAKPIEQQILDAMVSRRKPYRILRKVGKEIGMVNGLVVIGDSDEGRTGDVANVTAWLRRVDNPRLADFVVTGMPVEDRDTWMQNSIRMVRTTIFRLYGFDIAKTHYVHVSFVQSDAKLIDGPSAGITMTLALMSVLGDPRLPEPHEGLCEHGDHRRPVPMRQDTAVTGTVENIGENDFDIKVGPIGGVFEKVYGAKKWDLSRVIIPAENFDHVYFEKLDRSEDVEILGASTVLDFFDLVRGDK